MTDFRIGVVQNPKSVLVRREKKNGSNQPDEEMVIYFFLEKMKKVETIRISKFQIKKVRLDYDHYMNVI